MRTASIPEESWDAVPLFVVPGTHPASLDTTRVFTGSQLLPMVRRDASLPTGIRKRVPHWWGHGPRRCPEQRGLGHWGPVNGVEQTTRVIKVRGRWHSDTYEIYRRGQLQEHALASAAIT